MQYGKIWKVIEFLWNFSSFQNVSYYSQIFSYRRHVASPPLLVTFSPLAVCSIHWWKALCMSYAKLSQKEMLYLVCGRKPYLCGM